MSSAVEKQPLVVSNIGTVGPHLTLPYCRVPEVEVALKAHDIFYWLSQNVISFNGGPQIAEMYFGRKGDPAKIQSVLDQLR